MFGSIPVSTRIGLSKSTTAAQHSITSPHTFDLLFGLGLYAKYQKELDLFPANYDDFLSLIGMADAVTLGKPFDANVQTV
jgi:hypothetical protein